MVGIVCRRPQPRARLGVAVSQRGSSCAFSRRRRRGDGPLASAPGGRGRRHGADAHGQRFLDDAPGDPACRPAPPLPRRRARAAPHRRAASLRHGAHGAAPRGQTVDRTLAARRDRALGGMVEDEGAAGALLLGADHRMSRGRRQNASAARRAPVRHARLPRRVRGGVRGARARRGHPRAFSRPARHAREHPRRAPSGARAFPGSPGAARGCGLGVSPGRALGERVRVCEDGAGLHAARGRALPAPHGAVERDLRHPLARVPARARQARGGASDHPHGGEAPRARRGRVRLAPEKPRGLPRAARDRRAVSGRGRGVRGRAAGVRAGRPCCPRAS